MAEALAYARAELVRAWYGPLSEAQKWLLAECTDSATAEHRAERAQLRETANRALEIIRLSGVLEE